MQSTFPENQSDAVTEDRFRHLVGQGWRIEITCLASAQKRHANYFGQWVICAISPDGDQLRRLVTARNLADMRSFKTINELPMDDSPLLFDPELQQDAELELQDMSYRETVGTSETVVKDVTMPVRTMEELGIDAPHVPLRQGMRLPQSAHQE